MEIYKINNFPKLIKYGKYKDLVHEIHKASYGVESSNNILKNSTKILRASFEQKDNFKKNNNVLLVGKVQSGKTSNLEMLTALAFDNGYNFLIIYGGYDLTLLQQCVDRFSETFNVKDEESPTLISTDSESFAAYDEDYFDNLFEEGRPIILVALKRAVALSKVNDMLENINNSNIKAFIIDDEGDQASLNTKKNKIEDASATYAEIVRMKKNLKNPLYFSVTATPQANIFQPDISALRPDSIHLIHPANSYTGGEVFHLNNRNVYVIENDSNEIFEEEKLTPSLKKAIDYYLVASVIKGRIHEKRSDMIIHANREINGHIVLNDIVKNYINPLKNLIKEDNDDITPFIKDIKKIYTKELFSEEILENNIWDEQFEEELKNIIRKVYVVQKNSKNKISEKNLVQFRYKIYIGGDLLQRGVTFKHLISTYFVRWANKGNMDTSLQRARWFGYRYSFIELCKVFTSNEIKHEFSNLANIENDLWEQFSLVENNEMDINDIVVDAEETSLNPTRKNVTDYKRVGFARKWNNQSYVCTDKSLVEINNNLFLKIINNKELIPSKIGRNDNNNSCYYCHINGNEFLDFVNNSSYIFDCIPFNKKDLNKLINNKKICLQLMNDYKELTHIRKRSIYNGKVSALQQGADTTNLELQKYKGDSNVIVDPDCICIQISKVRPISDSIIDDLSQYMFSIHFPKKTIVYKKGDQL